MRSVGQSSISRGVEASKSRELTDLNIYNIETTSELHHTSSPSRTTIMAEDLRASPAINSTTNSSSNSASRHGSSGRNSMEGSLHSRGGPPPREYRKTARGKRQRETIGVMHVPGRILATLQRKFWDSNQASHMYRQESLRGGGGRRARGGVLCITCLGMLRASLFSPCEVWAG